MLVLINRLSGVQATAWKSSKGNGINPRLRFDGLGELLTRALSFTIG